MDWLKNIFSNNRQTQIEQFLETDIHYHILPGLDDGCATLQQSDELIKEFSRLGYKKLILSPHVIADYYPNTPENIKNGLEVLRNELVRYNLNIKLEAIAEYYVDNHFINLVYQKSSLLHIQKYILVETGFMNLPTQLDDVFFELKTQGYKPILAHPERYLYAQQDFNKLKKIFEKEVFFQINIMSLTGHYSVQAKQVCEKLIDNKMVHFVGSDCHHLKHISIMEAAFKSNYFKKLSNLAILNHQLG